MNAPTLCLISLGCNKNLVDSEVMLGRLKNYTLISEPSAANVVIINTCGFVDSAKEESIAKILEVAQNKARGSILVVSGCLSARYAQELQSEIPEIDIITGVGDYAKIDLLIAQKRARFMNLADENVNLAQNARLDSNINANPRPSEVFLIDNEERVITGSRVHAFIKISEGCAQKCSFCAIPHIKGNLHSRSLESIVREVERLAKNGYRDFSFIAQDSSSYMREAGKKDALIDLIDAIERTEIESARILYLYPSTTSAKLIERIAKSRVFVPYFDMPIQHISNDILRLMRRGRDKGAHIELLKLMRSIDNSFVRTTLLLGHPGEKERDFSELCDFVSEFIFDRINIFAFSPQENTRAFGMKNRVSTKITNARINALNAIIKAQQDALFKNYQGKKIRAIIEGASEQSELLWRARDMRWAPEIDGEILINENLTNDALKSGYYDIEITSYMKSKNERFLLGKALKRF